ncbi:MAG: Mrp/NBP35 family ATP-binding protein [Bdellovibrionaceae bacterium]|nr:Mrp/NBP35 family ATP-binding protein [Pseudobdellovibrionaceae bacterium]
MTNANQSSPKLSLPNIKHIILIGSGKGGVGKSTLSANISIALGKNHKVGLLDADIYGPSLVKIMGGETYRPELTKEKQLIPLKRHNIQCMSMGLLIEEGEAVVWRGPMLFKAISQLFTDVCWGDLDYLLIDLPPGTGDVPLTISQKVNISAAITVTTPQNLSLIDAKRAISMWKQLNVFHLGLLENMSYLYPQNPDMEKIQLFPKGDLEHFLKTEKLVKLAEVPFHPYIGLSAEAGQSFVEAYPEHEIAKIFFTIAKQIEKACPL